MRYKQGDAGWLAYLAALFPNGELSNERLGNLSKDAQEFAETIMEMGKGVAVTTRDKKIISAALDMIFYYKGDSKFFRATVDKYYPKFFAEREALEEKQARRNAKDSQKQSGLETINASPTVSDGCVRNHTCGCGPQREDYADQFGGVRTSEPHSFRTSETGSSCRCNCNSCRNK